MIGGLGGPAPQESPSVWRVWIEINLGRYDGTVSTKSPSVWRVWIEIAELYESYDTLQGHPPCGGCGLKLKSP